MKKTLIIAALAVFVIMSSNVISQAKTDNTTDKHQPKMEAPVKDGTSKTKPEKPSNDKDKQPPKDADGKTPPDGKMQPPPDSDGKTPPDGKQPPKSDGSAPPSKDLKDTKSSK